jgi:hypothetical protein
MKCVAIFPAIDLVAGHDRAQECIDLVTSLVVEALRQGGDDFHYAVDWLDPGAPTETGVFREDLAQPHIRQLQEVEALRDRIRKSIDPFCGVGSPVRSIATCRAATFGYDGQAFLCQRLEDAVPVTPDPDLVTIEEQPDFLTVTDWFDGWLPGTFRAANGC